MDKVHCELCQLAMPTVTKADNVIVWRRYKGFKISKTAQDQEITLFRYSSPVIYTLTAYQDLQKYSLA